VTHEELRLVAAGAALDDIDGDERAVLATHLATCPGCRTLAGQLDLVAAELALASVPAKPPPALGVAVLDVIRAIARGRGAASPAQSARSATDSRAQVSGLLAHLRAWVARPAPTLAALALAAGFAGISVALGVRAAALAGDLQAAQAATSEADALVASVRAGRAGMDAAIAVAIDPGHRTASLHGEPIAPGAHAAIVFRPGTPDAYLVAENLPATPDGRVYQLWVADGAGVHALGTFAYDGVGPFVAPFGVDLAGRVAAMVTLERQGGATGTPGPQVVFGDL
jgi:hypothetical protein